MQKIGNFEIAKRHDDQKVRGRIKIINDSTSPLAFLGIFSHLKVMGRFGRHLGEFGSRRPFFSQQMFLSK